MASSVIRPRSSRVTGQEIATGTSGPELTTGTTGSPGRSLARTPRFWGRAVIGVDRELSVMSWSPVAPATAGASRQMRHAWRAALTADVVAAGTPGGCGNWPKLLTSDWWTGGRPDRPGKEALRD